MCSGHLTSTYTAELLAQAAVPNTSIQMPANVQRIWQGPSSFHQRANRCTALEPETLIAKANQHFGRRICARALRHDSHCIFCLKTKRFLVHCRMGDRVLTISYAEPRRDDTQPQQKEVKACYVGHLPDDVDDTKLIEAFAPIGEVSCCC